MENRGPWLELKGSDLVLSGRPVRNQRGKSQTFSIQSFSQQVCTDRKSVV